VAAYARQYFPQAGIHFADVHAALAEAPELTVERIRQCRSRLEAGRLPQGEVVPELCAGATAFARGEYAEAVVRLGGALPELARVGGSHAQREVFEDSYIVACLRAGEHGKAADRLRARLARRSSARDLRWLAQAAKH
jgi:hypothetical protein